METAFILLVLSFQGALMPEHSILEYAYKTSCEAGSGQWVNEHTPQSACIGYERPVE